ncbi:MAG: hypothetical protein AB7V55_00980 [Oscillospiraceae bacterium]
MREKQTARRPARAGVGTGTTSLLMIFTVLCFATLAMLSLSTAASNQRIQRRGLEHTQSLSAARGEAAVATAKLDALLLALSGQHADAENYMIDALSSAEFDGWEADAASATVRLTTVVDEENLLITELQLLPLGEDARYTLLRQTPTLAAGWVPEYEGELWPGAG